MKAWLVYLRGKHIDTVFFMASCSAEDVRKALIEHDNYDPAITVKLKP